MGAISALKPVHVVLATALVLSIILLYLTSQQNTISLPSLGTDHSFFSNKNEATAPSAGYNAQKAKIHMQGKWAHGLADIFNDTLGVCSTIMLNAVHG